jgi:hypothetical protein
MLLVVFPIMFLSIAGFLHDPIHLTQSFLLITFTLLFFLFIKEFNWIKNRIFIAPILIPVSFLISAIINGQNIDTLLIGAYQRNFGLLTTLALVILFILCASPALNIRKFIDLGLLPLLILANIYGYLQFFNLDPAPWENENEGVTLTLGNPNFAGALFGMLSVITIFKIIDSKNVSKKVFYSLLFFSTLFIGIQTKSLQFIILTLISILVFLIIISYKKFSTELNKFRKRNILVLLLSILVLPLIYLVTNFSQIREKVVLEGNVYQRLDMIKNGLSIWQDNLFFGVGIDQFQMHAGLYRFSEQIAREGNMVIPDKSHNILIDYLATGGIISGLLWIIMNVSILVYAFMTLKKNQVSDIYVACVTSIWIAYLIQSMLSPDQILLASIGYGAAGFIVGDYLKTKKSFVEDAVIKVQNKYLIRIVILTILLITLVTYARAFEANSGAKKMLEGRFTSSNQYLEVLDSFPNTKVAELVVVELVKDYRNCELAEQIADGMIEIDRRNSQGWFIKAVCSNASKNFSLAIDYVKKSLLFDPYNPFYLISKAKLEAINGQLNEARNTLSLVKEINPPDLCKDNLLANTEPCANLREIISLEVSISKLEEKSS